MLKENVAIYDDKSFFDNYIDLRNDENNYNDLVEQPAMFELIGDVKDKKILDIGCGYGATTIKLAKNGARKVLGIDISEKMIEKGKRENSHEVVGYKVLPTDKLSDINDKFDLVVSCLVFHYIKDLKKLFTDISNLIESDGEFIFSMEHPICTASKCSRRWIVDQDENVERFLTDNYSEEDVRNTEWLGKSVTKYHHKLDTIFNALIEVGFIIEKVVEPQPDDAVVEKVPKMARGLQRPVFLIIKCKKVK